MKLFYKCHRPFKQLIVQLYKKNGAKSEYIRTDPGISYSLNHLMRVLYIKQAVIMGQQQQQQQISLESMGCNKKQQHITSSKQLILVNNDGYQQIEAKLATF